MHQSFLPAAFQAALNLVAPPQILNTEKLADPVFQEFNMSARNGDKSRFNRERKQKIARRKRNYKLLEGSAKALESGKSAVRAQPKPVSA